MTEQDIIADKEILELAEQYMDVFPDDYTATKEQLIAFAHRIALIAYDLGSADSGNFDDAFEEGLICGLICGESNFARQLMGLLTNVIEHEVDPAEYKLIKLQESALSKLSEEEEKALGLSQTP